MHNYNSQDTTELAKALINVQRHLQPATKDANNPFTKSKYASLNSVMDSCRDALLSNNIWLCQYPVPAEPGYLGLVTKLTHVESGQWQASLAVVPLPKADPQGVGISMTYMRRYALSAMLGIVTEEDRDGEVIQNRSKTVIPQKTPIKGPQIKKDVLQRKNTSGFGFECLKSNVRRTFETAGSGRHHLSGRSGTEWPTMHRRKGGYGSSKRFTYGCRIQMEPPTENMVEICRITERAVRNGQLFLFLASNGRNRDGWSEQKCGRGRIVENTSLRIGTQCRTAHSHSAWRPLPICRHVRYRQDVGLPKGGPGW